MWSSGLERAGSEHRVEASGQGRRGTKGFTGLWVPQPGVASGCTSESNVKSPQEGEGVVWSLSGAIGG